MQGLEIIHKESRRLTRMVEELLDFARIESGRMKLEVETFDLEMELYEAVYMYENMLANTEMKLSYHTDDVDSYFVNGDRHRMKQVFLNIIDNNTEMKLSYHTDDVDSYFVNGDRHRMKQVFLNIIDNAVKYGRSRRRGQLLCKRRPPPHEAGLPEHHRQRGQVWQIGRTYRGRPAPRG